MSQEADPSLLSFTELRARLRAGDAAAWAEFHARYAPLLRQMARRWLNPELRRQADSADMAQSVLRILMDRGGRLVFADEAALRAWLATVMHNRVVRLARRVRGPGGGDFLALSDEEVLHAGGEDPQDLASKAEAIHRLKSAMDQLTYDERESILLHEFEGLGWGDVARRIGRPSADAARKAATRALRRLRRLLRADGSLDAGGQT